MSRISPILQVPSTRLSVDDRAFVRAELRHQDRVRLADAFPLTRVRLSDQARDFPHRGCDVECPVPCALWAGAGDSLRGAGFRGVGYAGGFFACYCSEIRVRATLRLRLLHRWCKWIAQSIWPAIMEG